MDQNLKLSFNYHSLGDEHLVTTYLFAQDFFESRVGG